MDNEPKILDWKKIDLENDLVFEPSKPMGNHGGILVPVKVRYEGDLLPFYVATPRMSMPFGISNRAGDDGVMKYSVGMTFPGLHIPAGATFTSDDQWEGSEELVAFLKWVRNLQNAIIKAAHTNSQAWFRKNMKLDVISEFMTPMMSTPVEPSKYSPILNTGLKMSRNEIATSFWTASGSKMDVADVQKGAQCRALLTTSGVWFASKSFGLKLRSEQIMVFQRPSFNRCVLMDGSGAPAMITATARATARA